MSYWFIFREKYIVLKHQGDTYSIPKADDCPLAIGGQIHHVDARMDEESYACRLSTSVTTLPEGYELIWLRKSYELLSNEEYLSAGKCAEILYWDERTNYCGSCGSPLEKKTDISKRCPGCGKEFWPSLATAIIVLVKRGDDEVFLVQARNFVSDFYGLIAGFVETGETLEECVIREVKEETNLDVCNIKYFGSQPWPYPCGLMVGFVAEYAGGDAHLQLSELKRGGWFKKSNLPKLPGKLSMARMLLDAWLEE